MSQRFNFVETPLVGLYKIERIPIQDSRGFFSRFFCAEEFKEIGFTSPIAQINQTLTKQKGTARGMHYQCSPHTETKIVTCIRGGVFDVAIDIRKDSPTFLQWHAEILNPESQTGLYIPEGFAHGFQALKEDCELLYIHSAFYQSDAEGALNAIDPKLDIDWPLEITEISERDRKHPMIDIKFEGIDIK